MKLDLHSLAGRYAPKLKALHAHSPKEGQAHATHLKQLRGSSRALATAALHEGAGHKTLVVLDDKEQAAYFYNDLMAILPDSLVLFFPESFKQSVSASSGLKYDSAHILQRSEALNQMSLSQPMLLVTYPAALREKVLPPESLVKNTLSFQTGEELSQEFIEEVLQAFSFERVDFVYEPGQYAIRGSIMDIFSYAHDDPYRVDFFGDVVESIRTFSPESQLSRAKFDEVSLIPNVQELTQEAGQVLLPAYMDKADTLVFSDYRICRSTFDAAISQEQEDTQLFATAEDLDAVLPNHRLVSFAPLPVAQTEEIQFQVHPQPDYQKNFTMLAESLEEYQGAGYETYILSENPKQIERLEAIFESEAINRDIRFTPINQVLHEGFVDDEARICVFTDHELFQRYHKFRLKEQRQRKNKEALSLKELNSLQVGDYVVHVDHGVGKFGGLQRITVNGKTQETIRLVYKDNDSLFVNIHSLHRISKYRGKDGTPPRVYKLGSAAWQRTKKKTKSKVKDIARDLIQLYAKRRQEKGHAFNGDTYLQHELESSFIYEDTPDQQKATLAVKQDMEETMPMDRLVCGDVGFGKTEVAIRAAFKAINDSKQVAVLVPTTILAYQHYHTFRNRLKSFPVTVGYISRMRPAAIQRETLKDLKAGKIDILIGTHRLVGKDIVYKDLGLLIIDEEQKFGVGMKEKLRQIKVNVDTLTLTATPIPRTLQFSLLGARDLSVINTPPPNRYPIITELHQFNKDIIREAILYETARNGQVFFINNRVQNLAEVEQLINRVVPEVSTGLAHGKMDGAGLEKTMLAFINHEFDVLIATSIVESGLDIPNVNTIIINNAQNFGLSDLHQMRGRVGRSNKKAFAYLLAPPFTAMTPEAQRRLKAIEEFSELGSGFTLAMRDLDIRGAGDLLGAEQSGFINEIGLETYQKILDEAVTELRQEEFQDLFADKNAPKDKASQIRFTHDCQIETDLELLFPMDYVQNISERINLYRELDSLETEEELAGFESRLKDRFGPLPEQARELLSVVRLRRLAMHTGIEKIVLKSGKMLCHFHSDPNAAFYHSPKWVQIVQFIQSNGRDMQMKQNSDKLKLVIPTVKNIHTALAHLEKMSGA